MTFSSPSNGLLTTSGNPSSPINLSAFAYGHASLQIFRPNFC
jgi:hypothetical protein